MASTVKIILAVSGIFLAGAVTGGFAGLRIAEHYAREKRQPPRSGGGELVGGRLAEQLDLTPEQKQSIRPILMRTNEDLRRVRREAFGRTAELIARMDADISRLLNETQRARLREIRAKEEERRKQWLNERPKRNDGRSPGSGAPSRDSSEGPPP